MVRSQPARSVPLPWRAASEATARTAAGSTAALLRLAEAATLASAAGVRSVLDLTHPSTTSTATGEAGDARALTGGSVEEPAPREGEPEAELSEPSADPGGPVVAHWDELNLARIRGRLPRLSLDDIRSLLAYEHSHAARLPVLTMLENRIRKLEGGSEHEQDTAAPGE